MRENLLQPDRPQMTIKYGACTLSANATDTRSKYIIVTAFPRQHWLHQTRLNMTSYVTHTLPAFFKNPLLFHY